MSLFDATDKIQKEHYLDVLAVVYFVLAGLGVLITFGVLGVIFFSMTIPLLVNPTEAGAPIAIVGSVMGCIAFVAVTVSLVTCGLQAWAGWCLKQRKGYMLILVVAALMLMSVPLGTVVGVLTIMLLSDPEVRARFGIAPPAPATAAPPEPPQA